MPLLQDDSLQNTGTVVQERKKCPLLPCYLEIEEDMMSILGIQRNPLTATFVVSRCPFCKLRRNFGFFCSVNHFSEGGVNANHNVTCSPSLAENSKGNRDGEWIFCRRKEVDITLFLQVTRMRKTIKICEANLTSRLLSETGRSQSNEPWNTKQTKRIGIHQSRITDHDRLSSCK